MIEVHNPFVNAVIVAYKLTITDATLSLASYHIGHGISTLQ